MQDAAAAVSMEERVLRKLHQESSQKLAVQADEGKQAKAYSQHPYLAGNFRPVRKEFNLLPCELLEGFIPREFAGGQYIRNGANAYFPPTDEAGYHFFDGDGMLAGVFFRREANEVIVPCYVNKFVQTDVLLASQKRGRTLIPTIASLIAPISTYPVKLLITLLRTLSICYLSSLSRLSVANTSILFHNRKLLATCESGPMMKIRAPGLETEGWELFVDEKGEGLGVGKQVVGKRLGKSGQMLEEWTTGHPKVCPVTGDLVFYGYNIFAPPFVTHSVVHKDGSHSPSFKAPIFGVDRPKMMHDFGVSLYHSIILDLPLTMNPLNIILAQPMLHFNRGLTSRFGIIPRYFDGVNQDEVTWFEDPEPSLIFHTADAWDEGLSGQQYEGPEGNDQLAAVNFYCCRFRTSKLVFAAGGLQAPAQEEKLSRELSDVVRLTYMRFSMSEEDPLRRDNPITHAFSLSAIPFDFPVVSHAHSMKQHQFVYGCTLRSGCFDSALEGAKIDCIVKINAEALRLKGIAMAQTGQIERFGEVDKRSVAEILAGQTAGNTDKYIQIFDLPSDVHGQEPVFVPRENPQSEDDGYLVFYAYDEAQLLPNGDAPDTSFSQMYIIDALQMGSSESASAIVGIVQLPARVPYGLHSNYITAEQIESQLKVANPNAVIIQENVDRALPRLRASTVALSARNEWLEANIEQNAAKQTELTLWMWCASLCYLLLQQVGIYAPSPKRQSTRPRSSSASSLCRRKDSSRECAT